MCRNGPRWLLWNEFPPLVDELLLSVWRHETSFERTIFRRIEGWCLAARRQPRNLFLKASVSDHQRFRITVSRQHPAERLVVPWRSADHVVVHLVQSGK